MMKNLNGAKHAKCSKACLDNWRVCISLTCSGPMLVIPPAGPEFIELMDIWLPIWPMLLELVPIDTLRFMPLPLYMLLLACWGN